MIDVQGDLWTYPVEWAHPILWRCITTNGIVKANGELTMGKGNALQAKNRYPELPTLLGHFVQTFGNHVSVVPEPAIQVGRYITGGIISFPTKHHWRDPSNIDLIEQSAKELIIALDRLEVEDYEGCVLLPRPGCGLGGLRWPDVKEKIAPILDDRVAVIAPLTKPEKVLHG